MFGGAPLHQHTAAKEDELVVAGGINNLLRNDPIQKIMDGIISLQQVVYNHNSHNRLLIATIPHAPRLCRREGVREKVIFKLRSY